MMPKIFAAFAVDYKFLDGNLKIFELGNAFQSNKARILLLYGINQCDEVIKAAAKFAAANHLDLYCDLLPEQTANLYTADFYRNTQQGMIAAKECDEAIRFSSLTSEKFIICNAHIQPTLK